jgi:serine/threonine-protein kinase RsbW
MEQRITIYCQTTALAELRDFLRGTLTMPFLSENDKLQLILAVEEVCANLIIHSHGCNAKDHIDLEVKEYPGKLVFEITDKGKAFNLLDYEIPDLLVKRIMDEIEFESAKGTNTCRLIKWFQS